MNIVSNDDLFQPNSWQTQSIGWILRMIVIETKTKHSLQTLFILYSISNAIMIIDTFLSFRLEISNYCKPNPISVRSMLAIVECFAFLLYELVFVFAQLLEAACVTAYTHA